MPVTSDVISTERIAIDALEPGTTIVVNTRNSCYRIVILHEPDFVLVKGGTTFPDVTAVRYEGATAGKRTVVARGWIVVGLSMEMSVGTRQITTSRVSSVAIETMPVTSMRRHPSIN